MNATLPAGNPWSGLPKSAPYVLPSDAPILDALHRHTAVSQHYRLDLPPDPWQGRWDAPVVVLLQNPSHGGDDEQTYRREDVLAANRRNLDGNAGAEPLYWLDDRFADTYSGTWWRRTLRALREHLGDPVVRDNVLVVELYGYRTTQFRPLPITLPSQVFSHQLVEAAMARGATIVLPRAQKYWEIALPSLYGYAGLIRGKPGTRGASISDGNLEATGFDRVVAAITASQ